MPRSGTNAVAPEAGAAPATTNARATTITTRAITTASPFSFDHLRSRSRYHRSRLDLALPIGRGVNRVPELGHRPEHRRERLLVEHAQLDGCQRANCGVPCHRIPRSSVLRAQRAEARPCLQRRQTPFAAEDLPGAFEN